jgi:hypothetical protein
LQLLGGHEAQRIGVVCVVEEQRRNAEAEQLHRHARVRAAGHALHAHVARVDSIVHDAGTRRGLQTHAQSAHQLDDLRERWNADGVGPLVQALPADQLTCDVTALAVESTVSFDARERRMTNTTRCRSER